MAVELDTVNEGEQTLYLQLRRASFGSVTASGTISYISNLFVDENDGSPEVGRVFFVTGAEIGVLASQAGLLTVMPNCGGNNDAISASPPSASCSVPVNVYFFVTQPSIDPGVPLTSPICRTLAPGWKVVSVLYSGVFFTIAEEAYELQPELLCINAVIDTGPGPIPGSLFLQTGTVTVAGVTLVGPLDAQGPEEAFQ